MKLLPDTINPNELPEKLRKAQFSLKKAIKSNWSALEIARCRLKKINQAFVKASVQDTIATRLKTNSVQDTGPVRRGEMKVEEVLKLLEKHEEECNRRYAKIDSQLDKLDIRLWGIAALIVASAVAERFI